MLRAVIFDLDGTLYDNRCLPVCLPIIEFFTFRLGYLARERKVRRQLRGCDFDTEEAFYDRLFHLILPKHPERARRWYLGHYLPLQARILRLFCRPDAWVEPKLRELRQQGVKLALYSDYAFASQKLRALGLDPGLFDLIVDAPSLGGLKPSAVCASQVLETLGVTPSEAVFVGDRDDCDAASARKVGAYSQLVSRHGRRVSFSPFPL